MSWASDRRAPGRRRTLAPLATGIPPMVTVSVSGLTEGSLAGSHIGDEVASIYGPLRGPSGDDSAGRRSANSSPKGRCSPKTGTPSAPVPNSGTAASRGDPDVTFRRYRTAPWRRYLIFWGISSDLSVV